jgi:hypothetical protein
MPQCPSAQCNKKNKKQKGKTNKRIRRHLVLSLYVYMLRRAWGYKTEQEILLLIQ